MDEMIGYHVWRLDLVGCCCLMYGEVFVLAAAVVVWVVVFTFITLLSAA